MDSVSLILSHIRVTHQSTVTFNWDYEVIKYRIRERHEGRKKKS